jgi:hypothetical protein
MEYRLSWNRLRFTEYTYKTILAILPKVLSPDTTLLVAPQGFLIGPTNDETQRVVFNRNGIQDSWILMNRAPYTKDVMKALILMVEYGITEDLDHSDRKMTRYLEALDEVHAKHPLMSYEMQKAYFLDLEKEEW